MQLAMVAAGFTPGEADQLRRAMAAWRRRGGLEVFERRLTEGMTERGYPEEFAVRIFNQIKGFGEYGFPESHAASFALLVYVSAWLKHHEPAIFFCALLNSQPMGFYAPAQLVRCATEHEVKVRPVDVNHSEWESTLERDPEDKPVLRLGMRLIKGLAEGAARRVMEARQEHLFKSVRDLAEHVELDKGDLDALAGAGALGSLAGNRHRAHWDVSGVPEPTPLFDRARIPEGIPMLKAPTEGEDIISDYRHLGLSLRRHPLALLRDRFGSLGLEKAS